MSLKLAERTNALKVCRYISPFLPQGRVRIAVWPEKQQLVPLDHQVEVPAHISLELEAPYSGTDMIPGVVFPHLTLVGEEPER